MFSFWRVSITNTWWIISKTFTNYWCDHIVLILHYTFICSYWRIFSISGINPTLIYGVQSFYGIGGIFCSYFAKDVCLCSSMRYWSLTFFFCVFLVLVSGWWWTCKMSFGFPSTLEFWKCFRRACASSFLTGS